MYHPHYQSLSCLQLTEILQQSTPCNQQQSTRSRESGWLFPSHISCQHVDRGIFCLCLHKKKVGKSELPAWLRKNIHVSTMINHLVPSCFGLLPYPALKDFLPTIMLLTPKQTHLIRTSWKGSALWPLGVHNIAKHFHCVIITASCLWPSDISSCFLSDLKKKEHGGTGQLFFSRMVFFVVHSQPTGSNLQTSESADKHANQHYLFLEPEKGKIMIIHVISKADIKFQHFLVRNVTSVLLRYNQTSDTAD